MKTILNFSEVTDNSAYPPVTVYSNTVSTVIRERDRVVIRRYTRCFLCGNGSGGDTCGSPWVWQVKTQTPLFTRV